MTAPSDLAPLCGDFVAECELLGSLVAGLDADGWRRLTRFYSWSVYDEVAHLCLFDEMAAIAARDRDRFRTEQAALESTLAAGMEVSEYARRRYAHLDGPALAAFWRECYGAESRLLQGLDPKARLPWFGPDMSARSFVTARLMETWAHGQDVHDALGVMRQPAARLRHIAHLGVITYGWTFVNRALPVPEPTPWVDLVGAPEGRWTWGTPSTDEAVVGSALDFCLVVTQRRHYLDTHLEVRGENARGWLQIAQCFAGAPAMGPPAGTFRP